MHVRITILIISVCVIGIGGCGSPSPNGIAADSMIETRNRTKEVDQLRTQNEQLNARIVELEAREQELSQKIVRIRFDNEQLKRDVDVLSPAPNERDLYKTQVENLNRQIIHLQMQIDELQRKLKSPSTQTVTKP